MGIGWLIFFEYKLYPVPGTVASSSPLHPFYLIPFTAHFR